MNNTYKLCIGDWSEDGHEKSEFVHFRCNLAEAEVKAAYRAAVKKIGVGLHQPEKKFKEKHEAVCADYEKDYIPLTLKDKLEAAGVDFSKVGGLQEGIGGADGEGWTDLTVEAFAKLFLEIVRTDRTEFKWEIVKDPTPCVNGFWSKDFNIQMGYGLFS